MRNLVYSVAAMAALVLGACGNSSKEVAMAKTARYQGDKLQMFAEMRAAVESDYQIARSDETKLGMQSTAKWYTPEGMVVTRLGSPDRGEGLVPDRSVNFAIVAELLPDGEAWVVKVTPVMQQYTAGSPQPVPLKEDSADVPGWAHDRVDSLSLAIHNRLAKFQVQTVPSTVPPGSSPPAEAPAEGAATGSGPADGSAAAPPTP
jgi:hypothetical protein